MDLNHVSDLKDFLSDCIRSIKKSYPNFSSAQLAQRMGLSSSTFNRIENREIRKPTFAYALKIVREACGEEKVQTFIKNHYPEMYKDFETTYPGNADAEFVPVEAESFFQDANTYEIMVMATTTNGLTRKIVGDEFGNRGLQTLDKLIEKGVLKEEHGKFTLGTKVNAGQETVKKLLQNLINTSYDLSLFGTHKNWLSLQYESVNSDIVIPKIRNVYINANKEIREILNAPENAGNDVVWAGLVMDSLLKKDKQNTDGKIQ